MIEYSTNIKYASKYIDAILKNSLSFPKKIQIKNILRHTITYKKKHVFLSLRMNMPGKVLEYFPLEKSGGFLEPAPKGRAGILFSEFSDKQKLNIVLDNIQKGNFIK